MQESPFIAFFAPSVEYSRNTFTKTNFFTDAINPWHTKETFQAFHGLINLPKDKRGNRFIEYRDNRIQEYVDYIIVMMWKVRRALEQENITLPNKISNYQKHGYFQIIKNNEIIRMTGSKY